MGTLPLEGIRVIDFGQVWAGPVLGHYLADMGAEVIRIQTAKRIAGAAGAAAEPTDPANPHSYQTFQRNKLSITLDLTTPRGQELFKDLTKVTDIIFENFAPRVLGQWGLGYETLREINPRIILASLSAAGKYGPWRDLMTYGPTLTALYGIKSHLGYAGETQVQEDTADLDPTAATYAFFVILAALEHRDRTGKGQYIDLAQGESGACGLAESFLEYQMNGRLLGPQGNRSPGMAPQGIYRCTGEDRWVSIAVGTETEWQGFCEALGSPAWTENEIFNDKFQREKHQDELDELIEHWTVEQTDHEVMALLQAHGVAAFPVFTCQDIIEDPHFEQRRSNVRIETPYLEPNDALYSVTWKLSETPGSIRTPNVTPAASNTYVYGELLGLSAAEIEKLVEEKVIN